MSYNIKICVPKPIKRVSLDLFDYNSEDEEYEFDSYSEDEEYYINSEDEYEDEKYFISLKECSNNEKHNIKSSMNELNDYVPKRKCIDMYVPLFAKTFK